MWIELLAGFTLICESRYRKINEEGLHYRVNDEDKLVAIDSLAICAGQDSNNILFEELVIARINCQPIDVASQAKEPGSLATFSQMVSWVKWLEKSRRSIYIVCT